MRRRISALHDTLACIEDLLEAETRLDAVAAEIRASFGELPVEPAGRPRRALAERLRAYLDAHLYEPLTMAAAAAELDSGSTQLARSFAEVFGIPPHTYVTGRRLDAARDRILAGQALADVAAEVGFADEAHLTKRFKEFLGTTPGRFGRSG